ncbi:MAG: 30S ribosomal protein S12 methylthiotransferase RimO [Candidatus Omnitrophica bacterium]|nr:30S ribosomal protein S12 methylthiotransferase RimO [Candidatus Omnitrophota bacterium]
MSKAAAKPIKIGIVSLGCPKTLVDSEVILGKLSEPAYEFTPSVDDCDIALLNTCTFIQDAQAESVNRILELIELKKKKKIKALVVMGCLVQRFPEDLRKELKEVDAFIGSGDYQKIPELVRQVMGGERVFSVGTAGYLSTSAEKRVALTPSHYRYIKISEGCDHVCTFCTIPNYRGKHRSRTLQDVVTEARNFIKMGAKELMLTGQDTTFFGRDTEGKFLLPELIRQLDQLPGAEWLRLLYAYPSCVSEELMETMRDAKHLCHYLDMPLQHASDKMLSSMKRGITRRKTYDLIHKFRKHVPDLAIRTTFIVGFPGETDKDFMELIEFMKEIRFERVGVFTYSQEDGSPAAAMADQVPEKIKAARLKEAMLTQQEISTANQAEWVGKTLKVLVEGHDPKTASWTGRSYMDAPEIDGRVYLSSKKPLKIGHFYNAQIQKSTEYDLFGSV